ncbi:MAG: LysR substrate-binding domain-containing protein [Leisingera sp.]
MRLPPLNALKAFEAAVRLGGFTAAAAELGVSPAAVSMQVRKAEDFLGKTLFRRTHNSLLLTDAGRSYYPAVSEALIGISAATEQLMENEARSHVTVSTIQSLAEKWVAPAVAGFRALHPGTGIELRIEPDPVDLQRSGADVRITYETHLYPQHSSVPLFRDTAYPFCTKAFFECHAADGDLAKVPDSLLIHTDWGDHYASHPTWAGWFRASGAAKTPDVRKGLRVGGAAVAYALAAQGAGLALVPAMLIDHAAEGAALTEKLGLRLPYAYSAVLPKPSAPAKTSPAKAAAVQALIAELTPKD